MHFVVVLLLLQCMWISTLACPEGWKYYTLSEDVPGNCYKAFNLKVSWEEADKQCKSYHKSNLVDLKDAKEQDYVKAIVKDNLLPALTGIGDGVWLGARQRLEDWQWVGGQTMDIDTFSWLAGNPDNGGWLNELSDEDCLEMKKTGLLNDYKCFEKRPFICKMSNIEVLTTRVGECFNRTCMTPQTLCHQATSTSTILSAQTS
ncbi:snaclec coagulation factor IX-binding protein subunit A-like isoform X2 [Mya arenaria]|uniref:snaclec coagulation factor IX-binding protein subunit A-like isoform X2 n=1 Tax=Mya arenaria TaxID=6604 RepID=UPI0022E1A3FE|nr:snaclec coagulation factor IX-binding protein subunit A-like isoform X2 [Mya arenaria]